MKRTIKGTENNFHNVGEISMYVDMTDTVRTQDGGVGVWISTNQARRIDEHFCGIKSCSCGSSPVQEYNYDGYLIAADLFE